MDYQDKKDLLKNEFNVKTDSELARKLGISRQNLNRWDATQKIPAYRAILIERATEGRIKASDLWSDENE